MRPQDMPELRARLIDGWEIHAARINQQAYKNSPDVQSSLQPWKLGELYHVNADMTQLAYAAAKPLPDFDLRREDLPSEFGIIHFDVPISDDPENQIVCCAWKQATGAVELDFWGPSGLPAPYMPLKWSNTALVPYDGGEPLTDLSRSNDSVTFWAHIIRCAWLLMQQRVATTTDYLPDRASARRLARAGKAVTPVRVISLRRPEAHATGDHETHYHHRWVVRGHWRKQWYPSQERNVPIWITPYVKGPEGAPLLAGEKVYAWQR